MPSLTEKDNNEYDYNFHKSDISSTLTSRQEIILECMITQRTTLQTLEILKEKGFDITDRTVRKEKRIIREKNLKRLFQLAQNYDFENQHIERLQKLTFLEKGMFDDIRDCKDPYKRAKIREMICNLQPIISAYVDSNRYAISKLNLNNKKSSSSSYQYNDDDNDGNASDVVVNHINERYI
jgi:hypothetical protein